MSKAVKKTWRIDKEFSMCYGHRVYTQKLDGEYTGSSGVHCSCRHNHGHQGVVKVHLESDSLSDGMVTDFRHLNWFKDFLDDNIDHKFIMGMRDPLISHEVPELVMDGNDGPQLDLTKFIFDENGFWVPDLETLDLSHIPESYRGAVIEKYEGLVFVDFVPTSENLSSWLFDVAAAKMAKLGIDVVAVDFWETAKSHCHVSAS